MDEINTDNAGEELPTLIPRKREGRKFAYGGVPTSRITVSLDPQIVVWITNKKNRSKFINDILRIEKEKEENVAKPIGTELP